MSINNLSDSILKTEIDSFLQGKRDIRSMVYSSIIFVAVKNAAFRASGMVGSENPEIADKFNEFLKWYRIKKIRRFLAD